MIHHVYANQSNVGDWLSAQGIQSLLDPLQVKEHFCDAPFVPDTLKHLAKATERDFILIGGGGLFMDYFAPFWEGFREVATRAPDAEQRVRERAGRDWWCHGEFARSHR